MTPSTSPPRAEPGILVTGGAGLVGSRVVAQLVARGRRVVVADDLSSGDVRRLAPSPALAFRALDVARAGALSALFAELGPFACVVHLAARVGVARVLADPEGCRAAHLAAAEHLARALVEARAAHPRLPVPRLVAASSSEVYAESAQPLREGDPTRPLDGAGRWAYAASKLAVEARLDELARDGGPRPVHARLFNVTGPGQDPASGMVLPRFLAAVRAGRPLAVYGDGSALRTFAHVDDVARDLARIALDPDFPPGPLNLGGTARTTVLALAREVLRATGSDVGIVHVDPREVLGAGFAEVRHREPCLERARSLGLARRARSLPAIVRAAARPAREGEVAALPSRAG